MDFIELTIEEAIEVQRLQLENGNLFNIYREKGKALGDRRFYLLPTTPKGFNKGGLFLKELH